MGPLNMDLSLHFQAASSDLQLSEHGHYEPVHRIGIDEDLVHRIGINETYSP